MKRNCFKYLLFNCLWVQLVFISLVNAEFDEDSWIDPDAWTRDSLITGVSQAINDKCCKCPDGLIEYVKSEQPTQKLGEKTDAEDSASLIYFKKFVTMLFNRKKFKYDSDKQHYKRSVVFTINSNQMDKLENSQDPRDLDNILIDIFKNMHTEYVPEKPATTVQSIIYNILYYIWQLMQISEIRFLLVVMIIIRIAWYINRQYRIGWLLLISSGMFIYGYFHTYLECNRELEVNEMLKILNSNTEDEHKGFKFLKFLRGMFYSDDVKTRQQQKIKQSAKLTLGFCRPDHVLLMYFNDISLKYFEALIERCTVTISSLSENLGFPYNYLTPVFLVCMIAYILKLIFKYILSPTAWAPLLHKKQVYNRDQKTLKSSEDDRVSGENLKLLLNAINGVPPRTNVVPVLQQSVVVSGVEDLRETIESCEEKVSLKPVKKSTFDNSQNDSVSNKESINENLDVKLE